MALVKEELTRFKELLSPSYPACSKREVKDEEQQNSVKEAVLKITLHVLRNMKLNDLADTLQNSKSAAACLFIKTVPVLVNISFYKSNEP